MISGSSLSRVKECPGSEQLPHVERKNEWSDLGRALHKFLEDTITTGAADALDRVDPKHHEACACIALEKLPTAVGEWAAEVALAFDTEAFTARELGRGIERAYVGLKPSEIPATADVIGLTPDAVVVIDWKLGYQWLPEPATNPQLRFLGMAAALAYGKSTAHLMIGRLRDGDAYTSSATITALDFAQIAHEVSDILRAAQAPGAPLATGDHCRHCPAISACPAQTTLIRQLVAQADTPLTAADMAAQLTPEKSAEAWRLIKAAKGALEIIDEGVRLYASQAPVDLGGGKWLGKRTKETETLDGGAVAKVLTKRFGPDVSDQVVKMQATKKRLEDAVRTICATTGGKIAPLQREIVEDVRKLGGVHTNTVEEIREYRA